MNGSCFRIVRTWPNSTIFQHPNLRPNVLDWRLPKRFEDGVVLETPGIRDNSDNYKIDLYYPVLDSFLSELKRRFTDKNKDIMRALQACYPTSSNFLDTTHLNPLIVTYDLDLEALIMETQVAKRTLARKELEDIWCSYGTGTIEVSISHCSEAPTNSYDSLCQHC